MSDSSNAACPSVTVVILDADGCRIAEGIEDLTAIVLWATLSDDPATWGELLDCFPRYQVPAVTEFPDSLPFRACSADDVLAAIGADTCWMALDLTSCRAFCGPGLEPPEQNVILAAECGPNGEQKSPLPIHLPPWWEQHESASATIVFERRTTLIEIPMTNREFLYGDALIIELAFSILRAIAAGRLAGHAAEGSSIRQVLYRLSVEIHRDWLMTPREELNGGKPRDLLHGAHRWSDSVVHGQQVRADSGFPVVAAPKDGRRYANAPMGREEMIVYFDLCRELLDAGWEWSLSEEITEAQIAAPQEIAAIRSRLNRFLAARRDDWLESPFEGGSAPRFIIECSRRRVPRAMGVDIVGMDEREMDDHLANCDCPICDMMASGFGGLTFVQLDGHHLDLDEEFAFSVHQHFDDWQEEMREFACFNERMDQQRELPSADDLLGELRKVEFTSSDSDDARIRDSPMSDSPLSGDFQGHFKLAFRLAEIVSVLAERRAPRNLIRNLNAMFREYREGDSVLQPAARRRLFEHLEIVAERYPETLSRVSDFQSLVDETEREVTSSGDDFLNP